MAFSPDPIPRTPCKRPDCPRAAYPTLLAPNLLGVCFVDLEVMAGLHAFFDWVRGLPEPEPRVSIHISTALMREMQQGWLEERAMAPIVKPSQGDRVDAVNAAVKDGRLVVRNDAPMTTAALKAVAYTSVIGCILTEAEADEAIASLKDATPEDIRRIRSRVRGRAVDEIDDRYTVSVVNLDEVAKAATVTVGKAPPNFSAHRTTSSPMPCGRPRMRGHDDPNLCPACLEARGLWPWAQDAAPLSGPPRDLTMEMLQLATAQLAEADRIWRETEWPKLAAAVGGKRAKADPNTGAPSLRLCHACGNPRRGMGLCDDCAAEGTCTICLRTGGLHSKGCEGGPGIAANPTIRDLSRPLLVVGCDNDEDGVF